MLERGLGFVFGVLFCFGGGGSTLGCSRLGGVHPFPQSELGGQREKLPLRRKQVDGT